jgi:hypothetical protein
VLCWELVAEFVNRNLRAKPQLSDIAPRPTFDGVLSPGDKRAHTMQSRRPKHAAPYARANAAVLSI